MTGESTSNGRLTWRELNEMLEKRDARIERRLDAILTRVDPLPALIVRIEKNEGDIKYNKQGLKDANDKIDDVANKTNWLSGINATLAVVGSLIAAALGKAP